MRRWGVRRWSVSRWGVSRWGVEKEEVDVLGPHMGGWYEEEEMRGGGM